MNIMLKKKSSGQVALIVLLIMVVILTIGLSLASRSITDIRISQDEKEALRAFSAAEAGIEEALRQDLSVWSGGAVSVGSLKADVTVAETGERTTQTIEEGGTMSILLEGASSPPTSLRINWIDTTKSNETSDYASIEVIVYKQSGSNYTFRRFAYNAQHRNNGFTDISTSGEGNFYRQESISIEADDRLVRIKPLYNKATIMVTSDTGTLPVQQYNITSQAIAEGEKTSKIIVSRTIPVLPPIFDYVLFSGGDLSN